ncbi:hypothetical protein RIF29_13576 [Crotalaria pallida]|uniref:RING-type E3 ubiquitin transferase n=1 Tax=Crotalaria pallida TaxID=3830 RepID=A0AAN9IPL0_CROPI
MSSGSYYYSPTATATSSSDDDCCSTRSDVSASTELKIYRAFIFAVPIFFTFILLFLFYIFYLRPRRVDWSSLRMRPLAVLDNNSILTQSDVGLKKELREMLPIIVYKESFSVKDTQCSVCLLEYQSEDRLQQIPACGHTFHMSCIDLWLASHSTCPLCRLSLLASAKSSTETSNIQSNEETQATELPETRSTSPPETTALQNVSVEVAAGAHNIDVEGENARNNQ